jgi:hypothetical protein
MNSCHRRALEPLVERCSVMSTADAVQELQDHWELPGNDTHRYLLLGFYVVPRGGSNCCGLPIFTCAPPPLSGALCRAARRAHCPTHQQTRGFVVLIGALHSE